MQPLKVIAWTPDAIDLIAPAIHDSPLGDLADPMQELQGSFLFGYEHNGQHALVAIHRHISPLGIRAHVTALAALPGSAPLQTRQLMGSIETTAYQLGADQISMWTRHPKMASSAARWGGQITGAVIAKRLSKGH